MIAVTVELPGEICEKALEVAKSQKQSFDEFVTISLAQSLSRIIKDPYLEKRAKRATGKGIEKFLAQVPDVEPENYDRL